MSHRIIIILICLFFKCYVATAQSFQQYDSEDGLPVINIASITEDKHGNLWLGTFFVGVVKFDGKKFTTLSNDGFTLVYHSIFNHPIHADSIIAVSERDYRIINIYTLKGTVSRLPVSEKIRKAVINPVTKDILFLTQKGEVISRNQNYQVLHTRANNLIAFDSSMLIINRDKIINISDKGTEEYKIPETIKWISDAKRYNGKLLLATNNGIERISEETIIPVFSKQGGIRNLFFYENQLFVGTYESLFKLDLNDSSIIDYPNILPHYNFLIDREGIFWITSGSSGLYKNIRHDFIHIYKAKNPNEGVFKVHVNSEKIIIGTLQDGIKVLSPNGEVISEHKLNNATVAASSQSENIIFFGTSRGLWVYDIKQDLPVQKIDSLEIHSIYREENDIYIGTAIGRLLRYNIAQERLVEYDKPLGHTITAIEPYNDSTLLIGSRNGLRLFNKNTGHYEKTFFNNHSILNISVLNDSVVMLNKFGSSIELFDIKNETSLNVLNDQNYLSSNIIYFIEPSSKNTFWIGSSNSIMNVGISSDYSVDYSIIYNKKNGYLGGETNANSTLIVNDTLYFGTLSGLYKTSTSTASRQNRNELHLSYLIVNREDTILNTNNNYFSVGPGVENLEIHYDQVDKNNGVFEFTTTLANYTKLPIVTRSKSIEYFNLEPGDYLFTLNSKLDHIKSGHLTAMILIKPHFYQAQWFIGIAIVFIIMYLFLLIYLINRYKVNQVVQAEKSRQQEKREIMKWLSMDFHDDLGNKLARLLQFINVFEIAPDEQKRDELMNKMKNELRFIYNDTRQYIYSIDPEYTSAYSLFINLKSFGRDLFKDKNVEINFHFTGSKEVKLDPKSYAHLLKIFKEGLTNAYKYSGATDISCHIEVEGDSMIMNLTDNGIGFAQTPGSVLGAGLLNMRKRANNIQAEFKILSSTITGGTHIQLEYKFR